MSTSRKDFENYTSSYPKPGRQYPSQSVDYIAFDMGGQYQKRSHTNSNFVYNGKGYRGNQRRGKSNFGCDPYPNSRGGGYNQHKPRYTPRKTGDNSRNRNHNNSKSDISSYVHPSMTEDPWRELVERIDAIAKSRISTKMESDNETELEAAGEPNKA